MRVFVILVVLAVLLAASPSDAAGVKKKIKDALTAVKAFMTKEKPGDTLNQADKVTKDALVTTKKEQQQKGGKKKEQPKPSAPKMNTDDSDTTPPVYRTKKYDPVPAGSSMGNENDGYYWTLGASMCASNGDRYGLTNKHNKAGMPKDDPVVQPSKHATDEATGRRAVGKWTDVTIESEQDGARIIDIALFKFDDKAQGQAKVLGKAGKLLTVSGHVSNADIAKWPTDGTKVLYYSSRMCGWCGAPFYGVDNHQILGKGISMCPPADFNLFTTVGSEGPNMGTPGNSGSGLWEEQPDGSVKLVGIFNGNPVVPSIEDITTRIKSKLDLTVCTQ